MYYIWYMGVLHVIYMGVLRVIYMGVLRVIYMGVLIYCYRWLEYTNKHTHTHVQGGNIACKVALHTHSFTRW